MEPLSTSTPIMLGGLVRYFAEKAARKQRSEAEAESGPGVLVSSGLIAGGSIAGMLVAFASGASDSFMSTINLGRFVPHFAESDLVAFVLFLGLSAFLWLVATDRLLVSPDETAPPRVGG